MNTQIEIAIKAPKLIEGENKIEQVTILNNSQQDIDEISTDAGDISDEYGSASDSSSSIEKFPRNLSSNKNQLNRIHHQTSLSKMNNRIESINLCKEIWRRADAVCFDVDSTVCCDEAIDELAKYVGKSKKFRI